MGSGIAETAATNGFEVVLRSRSQSTADATLAAMEKSLNRQVEKGKKTEAERDEALARVTGTSDLAVLKDVDLVIESVVEDLAVKKELFNWTGSPPTTPSWPPTPPRCRSSNWPCRPGGPTRCAGSTSSTRPR